MAVASTELAACGHWLVKDPRSSLLIPLWREVARRVGIELRILRGYRAADDVAASLAAGNGMPIELAMRIWKDHQRSITRDAGGLAMHTVHHEDLLREPVAAFTAMAALCGIPDAAERAPAAAAIVAYRHLCEGRLGILHRDRHSGMEAASNAGITAGPGDFIAIHDDDDSWSPEFLERMVGRLHATGEMAAVCRSLLVHDAWEGGEYVRRRAVECGPMLDRITADDLATSNRFPPIAFVFRRLAYEQVGPFHEGLPALGDREFNRRIVSRYPIGVLPEFFSQARQVMVQGDGSSLAALPAGLYLIRFRHTRRLCTPATSPRRALHRRPAIGHHLAPRRVAATSAGTAGERRSRQPG